MRDMSMGRLLIAAFTAIALTLGLGSVALGQDWHAEADGLSSAAAASVVLFSLCDLDSAPRVANQTAALLRSHARRLSQGGTPSSEIADYLLDAANRKVNAFWMTNQARGCAGASLLRDLARPYDFPTPR